MASEGLVGWGAGRVLSVGEVQLEGRGCCCGFRLVEREGKRKTKEEGKMRRWEGKRSEGTED